MRLAGQSSVTSSRSTHNQSICMVLALTDVGPIRHDKSARLHDGDQRSFMTPAYGSGCYLSGSSVLASLIAFASKLHRIFAPRLSHRDFPPSTSWCEVALCSDNRHRIGEQGCSWRTVVMTTFITQRGESREVVKWQWDAPPNTAE